MGYTNLVAVLWSDGYVQVHVAAYVYVTACVFFFDYDYYDMQSYI